MSSAYTLLMRLQGPMQSWGYRSRFDYRNTALEPTRSGVIGLLCAAMGISRGEDVRRFDSLRMGVRVDKEGRPECDYHTALEVITADGIGKGTVISRRDYLADAVFTVGLETGDTDLLYTVEKALNDPVWFLFLGRKSFCLTAPPLSAAFPAISRLPLEEALSGASFSLLCKPARGSLKCRYIIERPDGERTQHDWPLCFRERRFKTRAIHTCFESDGVQE
ncbi:type I-E CRISPR-associated protein Cas5/CasD [bacterium]|nr:type I-E CRISPR-associated protein Cas5/CasD [candidate division CSSED10-310 bacterium]